MMERGSLLKSKSEMLFYFIDYCKFRNRKEFIDKAYYKNISKHNIKKNFTFLYLGAEELHLKDPEGGESRTYNCFKFLTDKGVQILTRIEKEIILPNVLSTPELYYSIFGHNYFPNIFFIKNNNKTNIV